MEKKSNKKSSPNLSESNVYSVLSQINSPKDLKFLTIEDMNVLSKELRDFIIKQVSISGGHLASSLGVIELTIALHSVFNSPTDKIVWDVGHQSYPHKLLTGRRSKFHTLRQYGGISGFPKRSESPHDCFGTGHSSTSISAALGILEGRDRIGKDFKVIAVIGDGALTGGLAYEGLNNAGHLKKDLIVVLNDNEMSISKSVGALSSYLSRILSADLFKKFKKETMSLIETIPRLGEHFTKLAQKTEDAFKYMFLPGIIFEELGFNYVGPLDGHDIAKLIDTLNSIKRNSYPTLLHIITKKGRGYEFSERNPCTFHGIGPFELDTGETKKQPANPNYSDVFGETMIELAEKDSRLVAITAAMEEGTGLKDFKERYPERFYDVGIAEPHAVTFAAGLAVQGLRPIFAVYSTFLQRAYDHIVHDVCLQNLPVVFAIDRAGIVGEDGPTHHGIFDISYLRHIPNLTVMAPKNGLELKDMLKLALRLDGPCAIRFPRGCTFDAMHYLNSSALEYGKAEIVKPGNDIAILAVGHCVTPAYNAALNLQAIGIDAQVINIRFVKPIDRELMVNLTKDVKHIVTVEENAAAGGFGSALLELLNNCAINDVSVKIIGTPDRFIEHGKQELLRHLYGLDEEGIYQTALSALKQTEKR
ncbi:1-deoxy-D-xylulose-5-phosphate synthase [Candidatus Magnetoovum chiemensis]|nr:1-deoxy-D-xylulose-5-phosphate synthase [Candidatus Magnetoovum chiemensis]